MRKRLFISIDFPPSIGGIQNYVYGLVSNLDPEQAFVIAQKHRDSAAFDSKQKFKIYRTSLAKGNKAVTFFLLVRLFFLVMILKRRHRITDVHFGTIYPVGVIAPLLRKLLKLRVYSYIHGFDVLSLQSYSLPSKLLSVILNNTDKMVCNSKYTSGIIKEMGYGSDKIEIIHPGIDLKEVQPCDRQEIRRKWGIENRTVLLTVSRIVERKGHDIVIQSIKHLYRTYPDIIYVICGDGPYKRRLEELIAEHGLSEYVLFTGSLEQNEVDELYMASDIFIMPSRSIREKGDIEGYGIVFLEANFFGLPVIGGNSGGIPDAIIDQSTGFLVDPLDPLDVSDKVSVLLKNSQLASKMGKYGQEWVKGNCLWKHRIQVLEQI